MRRLGVERRKRWAPRRPRHHQSMRCLCATVCCAAPSGGCRSLSTVSIWGGGGGQAVLPRRWVGRRHQGMGGALGAAQRRGAGGTRSRLGALPAAVRLRSRLFSLSGGKRRAPSREPAQERSPARRPPPAQMPRGPPLRGSARRRPRSWRPPRSGTRCRPRPRAAAAPGPARRPAAAATAPRPRRAPGRAAEQGAGAEGGLAGGSLTMEAGATADARSQPLAPAQNVPLIPPKRTCSRAPIIRCSHSSSSLRWARRQGGEAGQKTASVQFTGLSRGRKPRTSGQRLLRPPWLHTPSAAPFN